MVLEGVKERGSWIEFMYTYHVYLTVVIQPLSIVLLDLCTHPSAS